MGYIELSSARIKWHLWHESRFKLDAFLALLFRVVKTFALMQHCLNSATRRVWDDVHFDHHLTSQVAKEEKKGPTTVIINSSGITTAMLKDCNSTIE